MNAKFLSESAGAFTLVALVVLALLVYSLGPATDMLAVIMANLRIYIIGVLLVLSLMLTVLGRRRRGLLFAAASVGALLIMAVQLSPHTIPPAIPGAKTLKIVSFNVLETNVANGQAIADYLTKIAPDIAFIQEATPVAPFFAELQTVLPFRIGCGVIMSTCDLLLMSKYPLDAPQSIDLSSISIKRLFSTAISVDGQKINIVAPHLTKPYIGRWQAREFKILERPFLKMQGPVIVAGDFNSAAWAPGFLGFLSKTGLRRAAFEPATWPVEAGWAGVPIDHILAGGGATIASLQNLPDNFGSNHRGLIAEIALPPK